VVTLIAALLFEEPTIAVREKEVVEAWYVMYPYSHAEPSMMRYE
jgi:hypothetical protein